MFSLSAVMLACHYSLVAILCLYGSHRIYHTWLARMTRKTSALAPSDDRPFVTVQAPMFNEKFVAERIIDALAGLNYPKEKLQIQVIDDSNDDSAQLIARRVAHYKALGFNIQHLHRTNRQGYKAGALAEAMDQVSGEFIAIFDADFIPNPDFLLKAIPHFSDPKVGVVQSRWTYLNRDSNILTRVQGIMLDAHFGVEQVARFETDAMFNFNGTAGVWRKSTIMESGGWRADTLTEDIDLSYRAQMAGWKFIYLKDLESPSEIPADMRAFKVQQHRWAKGAIQVMKKLLLPIWKSPISLHAKIEASFHLTGNFCYMLMFIDSVFFLIPSVHIRQSLDLSLLGWLDIPLFVLASASHAWFFLYSQKLLYGRMADKLLIMPVLLATSIGLGVNNGRAVLEALAGHVTGFERTPKVGEVAGQSEKSASSLASQYKALSTRSFDYIEIMLAVFYAGNLIWAVSKGYWVVVPFLALFTSGFLYTGLMSLLSGNAFSARKKASLPPKPSSSAAETHEASKRLFSAAV
jgi:cellulose synthase/poly-beta-1,6-N-acetylglucosamine synthase-like glycosyltransferase